MTPRRFRVMPENAKLAISMVRGIPERSKLSFSVILLLLEKVFCTGNYFTFMALDVLFSVEIIFIEKNSFPDHKGIKGKYIFSLQRYLHGGIMNGESGKVNS